MCVFFQKIRFPVACNISRLPCILNPRDNWLEDAKVLNALRANMILPLAPQSHFSFRLEWEQIETLSHDRRRLKPLMSDAAERRN
jgi:hypothetical protein